MATQIFISHKESEREIAKKLVEFLEASLDMTDGTIRCTSVPGYQLPFGKTISHQLKEDIHGSIAVLALLTHESIHSDWVLFELGASWALSKVLIPILAPGINISDLPGPTSEYPVILIDQGNVLNRLLDVIDQLSSSLGLSKKSSSKIHDKLNDFIATFQSAYWFLYEEKYTAHSAITEALSSIKVILSETDKEQVKEWLSDKNSGYPDFVRKLLTLLAHYKPKGNKTVLDAIMGKYRIESGKSSHDFIPPPYHIEIVRKAYVRNWRERNSGEWSKLSENIKNDYRKIFGYIVS
jgi:hypothetical protein